MSSDGRYEGPICDTHQHLWDLERVQPPWLVNAPHLNHSHLPSDYIREADGTGIVRTLYMEVDAAPEQQMREAEYAGALCRDPDYPMVAAVLSGRPAEPGFAHYLEQIAERCPVVGIRQVLHGRDTPDDYFLRPEFISGLEMLGSRGLSFDLCIRPSGLDAAPVLCRACPELQFILDHCGNPTTSEPPEPDWLRGMERLAAEPNVACKISGIVVSAAEGWGAEELAPYVDHAIDCFGADRIVFGGDWPVCTRRASLAEWVSALKEVVSSRPAAVQRALFWENAHAIYSLPA